ncbi:MAG: trimethylamine methyltransferase family protein [bacterium]|nr:trimethylamine methyltransferase family protein [bacterium]
MARRKRGGGRAARIAARQRGPTEEERAIWPGIEGGAYRPLTESDMERVYETALDLIEEIGMGDPIPEFTKVVTNAGGHLDDNNRLHYPRSVVQRVVEEKAAKEWVWFGLDEDKSIELSGNKTHFGTAGAAVLVLDYQKRVFNPSTTADLYDAARLNNTLENIHFFVRTLVTRDLQEARDVDINTAYITMMGTDKPQGTSFFQPQNVHEVVEMYDYVLGGEGEYRKRPFVCANNTFVVPPLRFAYESNECMVAQIEAGMPINILSAGQAGATSPAALGGSLVQAVAECLAGLTNVNLISPGHPCAMGLWPFVSDLRTGAMTGGSGESGVLNAAAGQIANWLGLPSCVAAGMADSKLPDNQAGYEKGMTTLLCGQAGTNLVYESAGMLGSLLGYSHEALVIDNDMLGAVIRTIRGVDINDYTLSKDVIRETVEGPGHFLGSDQTLHLMQREYIYPAIGDRNSPDDWRDAGAKSSAERAHEYVKEVMKTYFPTHISRAQDEWIRSRLPIALPVEEVTGQGTRW